MKFGLSMIWLLVWCLMMWVMFSVVKFLLVLCCSIRCRLSWLICRVVLWLSWELLLLIWILVVVKCGFMELVVFLVLVLMILGCCKVMVSMMILLCVLVGMFSVVGVVLLLGVENVMLFGSRFWVVDRLILFSVSEVLFRFRVEKF